MSNFDDNRESADFSYVYQPSHLMEQTIKILSDANMTKALYLSLVRSAQHELLIIFPTTNAIRREEEVGIFNELRRVAQRGVMVRILTPEDAFVRTYLDGLRSIGIIVKKIEISPEAKFKLLTVDKRFSLVIETKDDTRGTFEEAIGFAIFSNSKPTVMPMVTIFDSFWRETELYEQAREADKIKSEFVSVAAHELRNPITPIMASSDFAKEELKQIKEGKFNENTIAALNENINIILRNSAKLYRVSEDILQASRIESGNFALSITESDMKELLTLTIEDAKKKADAENKNIDFSLDYRLQLGDRASSFKLYCDSSKINQVLYNLLDNAIRFTRDGGKVTLYAGINKENEIIIKIKDSGPGIDPSLKDKLFEKFESRSDGGTGLGLFICKKIVEAHGGKIWGATDPSGGAIFSFTLPSDLQIFKENNTETFESYQQSSMKEKGI